MGRNQRREHGRGGGLEPRPWSGTRRSPARESRRGDRVTFFSGARASGWTRRACRPGARHRAVPDRDGNCVLTARLANELVRGPPAGWKPRRGRRQSRRWVVNRPPVVRAGHPPAGRPCSLGPLAASRGWSFLAITSAQRMPTASADRSSRSKSRPGIQICENSSPATSTATTAVPTRNATGPTRTERHRRARFDEQAECEHQAAMTDLVPHRNLPQPPPVPRPHSDVRRVDHQAEEDAEEHEHQPNPIHPSPLLQTRTRRQATRWPGFDRPRHYAANNFA